MLLMTYFQDEGMRHMNHAASRIAVIQTCHAACEMQSALCAATVVPKALFTYIDAESTLMWHGQLRRMQMAESTKASHHALREAGCC